MTRPKTSKEQNKLLTDVELELMTILWSLGEANVAMVLEQLPPHRDLAYTSVSTILRILEQKKIVKTRKEGRSHIYIPLLKKADHEAQSVSHIVERVFGGAPTALVRQLIDTKKLTEKDLEEIRNLIEKASQSR